MEKKFEIDWEVVRDLLKRLDETELDRILNKLSVSKKELSNLMRKKQVCGKDILIARNLVSLLRLYFVDVVKKVV